ncbi:MAG: EAL domain-containing protein [Halofilum sp. (in: g-proteobacteria)]|nr:EAL domain-containing protein [Halofilum sp. (in: g-proteobacteria)]
MSHECQCHSADRPLALVFGSLAETREEVGELVERFAADWSDELATAVIRVGPGERFAGAGAVNDLLLAVLGPDATRQVRATWLDPGPLEGQMSRLLRAESIEKLCPGGDSPLAGILERRELETWFQPVLDRDGATWGFECLMRARDDNGEPISPAKIFEWAGRENLLFMLDRVARETHIASAHAVDVPGHVRFLINFQPTVIYEPAFCLRTTFEALKETGMAPGRFIFEVVETEQVDDHERLREILDYYRDAGFGVALDDVASGYSGLSLMADLEPDLIKIDRALVARTAESAGHADICASLVQLARRTDKQVLAEGIETDAQHRLMCELGVDLFQGFLFGKPAPEPVVRTGAS